MKTAIKQALKAAAVRMPWGAREAVFEALVAKRSSREMLSRSAALAGITGFLAPGKWGIIQSSAADQCLLTDYAKTGDWAATTHGAFTRFFAETGGTYIDVGSNIGLTVLPVAVNPAVRCFAFEPEPTNFTNLAENVRRNAVHGNVVLHQLALADRTATLRFGLADDGNLGDHRLVSDTDTRRSIAVAASRLDDLDLPIAGPLGVKIDTQGAEPAIIAGGRETLARAGLAVLEFSPMLMDRLGGDPEIVLEYLAGFDRVAVTPGESDAPLAFGPAADACATLRAAYARSRAVPGVHFDVYAERVIT